MNKFSFFCLLLAGAWILSSCEKDDILSTESISTRAVCNYSCTDYTIDLTVDYSTPGTSIFTWSITNPCPGNGKNGTIQDLSHWDFDPGACLDANWQDVVEAYVNIGAGWNQILPLPYIQSDPSLKKQNCFGNDVFKFDYGTTGSVTSYYRLVLMGHWGTGPLNIWYKSGKNTGCCNALIEGKGIGCRIDESCSYSQGYWFANNAMHPNGVHPWPTPGTVTIGGKVYTNQEGLDIWNSSNAGGIEDSKKAFTQLSAVCLSGVMNDPGIALAVATIECWLTSLNKLDPSYLPNQTDMTCGDAKAAASAISAWINANHCEEQ
jgi:hypothetical protein